MQKLSILGSTGSIGWQTLEVADALDLEILALSANRNTQLLERQGRKYQPELIAVYDELAAADLKVRLRDTEIRVVSGMGGLLEAATLEGADTVVTAVVGTIGLEPTLAAVKQGKRIALANKETLVCAGELVMETAKASGAQILPVDSEHSAIFQCLQGRHDDAEVNRLILTSSGGPFLGWRFEEMLLVTREMALRHPNWNMGPKITVDSATMMNKGLEFIEAMHLFGLPPEKISILVHPESIIHSMVEYVDNSVIAQLGVPDMRLPIQYALTYPARTASLSKRLNLAEIGALTFKEPDFDAFRCPALAIEAAKKLGTAPAVLNAANEAAVTLFLENKITFYGIYELVFAAVERIKNKLNPTLNDILSADAEARRLVETMA